MKNSFVYSFHLRKGVSTKPLEKDKSRLILHHYYNANADRFFPEEYQ